MNIDRGISLAQRQVEARPAGVGVASGPKHGERGGLRFKGDDLPPKAGFAQTVAVLSLIGTDVYDVRV